MLSYSQSNFTNTITHHTDNIFIKQPKNMTSKITNIKYITQHSTNITQMIQNLDTIIKQITSSGYS